MGLGLPFVFAGDYTNLDSTIPYCLKVPNNESAINIEDLVKFALSMRDDKKVIQDMKRYAREHFTWKAQFQKTIKALEENG